MAASRATAVALLMCVCGAACFAAASADSHDTAVSGVTSASAHATQLGWTAVRRAAGSDVAHLVLALRQRCTARQLETALMAVADPASPDYGKHWTLGEVADFVAAPEEAVEDVRAWLSAAGVPSAAVTVAATRDFVVADVPVAVLEGALAPGVVMQHWSHPRNPSKTVLRSASGKIALPTGIVSVLDAVEGIFDFPAPPRARTQTHRRRAAARAAAQAAARPTASNAPQVSLTTGVDSGAMAIVIPVCYDGSPAAVKAGQLCGGSPPAITGFEVTVTEVGGSASTASVPATLGDHGSCSGIQFTNLTQCLVTIGNMVNYQNYTFTVATKFAGGKTSASSVASPYDVIPTAWVTPAAIARAYNIPPGTTGAAKNNGQAVIEFDQQYYSTSDLATFTNLMSLPQPDVTVHGADNSSDPGGEATLDIQLITSVGQGVPTTFWYQQGYLLDYLAAITSLEHPPLVNSISYGNPEKLSDVATMQRTNMEFMKAGLRGITIISTAGDLGVSDGVNCSTFYADFPSSSPYTTSLGATRVARLNTEAVCEGSRLGPNLPILCADFAETPCSLDTGAGFTTGGMFSGIFPRPSWQESVVGQYLKGAGPTRGNYNASGRGYNDVAAYGNNILVVDAGAIAVSGGTSASGPIFAAVVSLFNGARINAGKPPLGFVNPLLYSIAAAHPNVFNNVQGGNNRCGEQMCCTFGLPGLGADDTWSPLGGLGSPDFAALLPHIVAA